MATPTVRFHSKVLQAPDTALATMVESMRQAYATQGIGVEHATSANLDMADLDLYLDVDTGACAGSASVTDEQRRLMAHGIADWSGWTDLGGQIQGAPTTVSRDPSVCNVYARGMDDALWQRAFFDGSWHDWGSLGGGLSAAPAADSMRPGHEHVYVRGLDGAVWHRFWTDSAGWSEWFNLGAPPVGFEGAPSTISRNPDASNVYVRGTDSALWQRAWFAGQWHGWARHDDSARLSAEPAPGTMGRDHEHVFVRGLNGSVWSKWWFGAGRDRELVVFFVRTVTDNDGTLNGCAAHPDGRPAAVVASYASTWTLGHEIGHVLGLNHLSGENCTMPGYQPTRLMTGCGTGRIVDPPAEIDSGERSTIVSNPVIVQR